MGELTIRGNRIVNTRSFQTAEKTEKTESTAKTQRTAKTPGFTVSQTLRELTGRVGRAEAQTRESHRTLQTGEAVLAEVRDSLDKIADLINRSSSGGAEDREALQQELERLCEEIDRMTANAFAGGNRLFLDGEMDDVGGTEGAENPTLPSEAEDAAQALPDWLLKSISQSGLTPERLVTMLGLNSSASGAELLAAIQGSSLENDAAAAALAALYLGAAVAGNGAVQAVDLRTALEGLQQFLERVQDGMPPDQALELLTGGAFSGLSDLEQQFTGGTAQGLEEFLTGLLVEQNGEAMLVGSSMLAMLAGMEGTDLELLMGLLSAVQGGGLEAGLEAELEAGEAGAAAGEAARNASAMAGEEAAGPTATLELNGAQVSGKDLSGVSAGTAEGGGITIGGEADVTVRMSARGQTLTLAGSGGGGGGGTVTLRDGDGTAVTVDASQARLFLPEETTLGTLQLRPGAGLTLGGGGLIRLTALQAEGGNVLRLSGGAVVMESEDGETLGTLPIPVVLDGPASLAAQAGNVQNANGKALDPFDVVWKTLLPGWESVHALSINGQQARLNLHFPETLRLWLDKGDPSSQGSPIQELIIRGKDRFKRPKIRYAYVRWNESAGTFEEVPMYPNPFTVTGGEAGEDWVYEEESQTLRVLTNQVASVTGGAGVDANQEPFSGRIALTGGIGELALTLGGVECRVASGRAFSLGQGNQVTLTLERGSQNHFESGPGFAGISLGDGTRLCVDCAEDRDGGRTPAGALTASGGKGGAGIGRDSGAGVDQTTAIEIRGGEITALGRDGGAGIGAGKRGAIGEITVLGGTVDATGERGGAGIGAAQDAAAGNIRVQGGTVRAAARGHAAAIGAGVRGACGEIAVTSSARIAKAQGGDPGADIGACLFGSCGKVEIAEAADIGRARLWTRTGVPLQMGEETVTLPQFRLSAQALGLSQLSIATKEAAKAAKAIIDADRRWVAQIQTAYGVLYDRLERNSCALRGVQRYFRETGLVRDTKAAGDLLEDTRRAMPYASAQAGRVHGKRGKDDVRRLFR